MKKRIFAALLLALLLALGASAQALAEEPEAEEKFAEESGESSVFQRGSFSGPQTIPGEPLAIAEGWESEARTVIYNGLKNRSSAINVSSLGIPRSKFDSFYSQLLNDCPELFYVDSYRAYSYSQTTDMIIEVRPRYLEFADLDQAISDFNAAANRALAQIKGLTDPVEIALVLHDWLVVNCEYNWYVGYHQSATPGSTGNAYVDSKMPWSAYGALVKGDAVCQGYALAYKYLLTQASIPCVYISSSSMNHAWNAVQINGHWYQVDATWDDPTPNREGRAQHAYFLLSDNTFGLADSDKGRSAHYGWDKIVTCDSTAYESGYVFVDNNHPLYRWNNNFYYVKSETMYENNVYKTASLNSDGNRLSDDLGLPNNAVILWVDGRLYVMPGPYSGQVNEKVLLVYDLDNGVTAQAGHFTHTPAASPDGNASAGSDNYPGLRYNAQTNEVEVVSCTRRQTVYSVPAVPLPDAWSGAQAGGAYQAGVASGVSDSAAAVVWGENPQGSLSLWAAFYDNSGKLLKYQAVGSSEIARANVSDVTPKMVLAYLDPPSSYASVKLMLLTADRAPVCAAG